MFRDEIEKLSPSILQNKDDVGGRIDDLVAALDISLTCIQAIPGGKIGNKMNS